MRDTAMRGHWKQIRGKAKDWWGKLTDDDLDMIDGNRDQLILKLQQRYGYTKERAAREVNARLNDLESNFSKVH